MEVRMVRQRCFDGEFLAAKAIAAEQDYHREKRWLHNRMLHGVGVVDGLAVAVDDGSGTAVVGSLGVALDGHGREIQLEGTVCIDLGICTGDVCFITIEFTETPSDPVPGTNGAVGLSPMK